MPKTPLPPLSVVCLFPLKGLQLGTETLPGEQLKEHQGDAQLAFAIWKYPTKEQLGEIGSGMRDEFPNQDLDVLLQERLKLADAITVSDRVAEKELTKLWTL